MVNRHHNHNYNYLLDDLHRAEKATNRTYNII